MEPSEAQAEPSRPASSGIHVNDDGGHNAELAREEDSEDDGNDV